jgi:hypothetical protein
LPFEEAFFCTKPQIRKSFVLVEARVWEYAVQLAGFKATKAKACLSTYPGRGMLGVSLVMYSVYFDQAIGAWG